MRLRFEVKTSQTKLNYHGQSLLLLLVKRKIHRYVAQDVRFVPLYFPVGSLFGTMILVKVEDNQVMTGLRSYSG